jgi:hypothetical protein
MMQEKFKKYFEQKKNGQPAGLAGIPPSAGERFDKAIHLC